MTEIEKFTLLSKCLTRYIADIAEIERYRIKAAEMGTRIADFPALSAEHVFDIQTFTERMNELHREQLQALVAHQSRPGETGGEESAALHRS